METWLLQCVLVGGIFRYARDVDPLAKKNRSFVDLVSPEIWRIFSLL